jgi:hypothetical protein
MDHASFYPLEFLSMSKVTAQIVVAQSDSLYLPNQKFGESNEPPTDEGVKFLPIKQSYQRAYDSERNFKQFSRVDQSLTQMPLEILFLRPAKSSAAGLFSNNPDSYTFKSQAYFSLPVHCTLMSELCQTSIFDEVRTDLD